MKQEKLPKCDLGPRHGSRAEAGVALVLTLLVVAMLTVVVVGFTAVSRLEQISARNMTYQSSAEQLAQLATGKGMERLSQAMAAALAAPMFASQPGQISPFGAAPEPLYSQGGTTTNVNAFTAGGLITGNPADVVGAGVETVNDVSGNAIGRIAYYIDDESTKIAVNQATGASVRPLNPQWPRPFAIQGADGVAPVRAAAFNGILGFAANNASNASNWTYFFTPEQLRGPLSAGPLPQLTVALETNPASINTAPWGTQKIRINQIPVTDAGVAQLVQGLSDPKLSQVFGQTFANKYTREGLRQLAANMLQLRTDHWRGGVKFDGLDPVLGTSQLGGSLTAPPGSAMLKKTNGIPPAYFGYVPYPLLTEVAVGGVEYGFTTGPAPGAAEGPDDNMSIRFFVACKLYNPYPVAYSGGGVISVQVDKARVRICNDNPITQNDNNNDKVWRGPDGTHRALTPGYNDMPDGPGSQPWDPWGLLGGVVGDFFEKAEPRVGEPGNFAPPVRQITPVNGVGTIDIPAMAAQSTVNLFVPFTITTSARHPSTRIFTGLGAEMYIIVDQVKMLASRDQITSVRDWCSGPDMKQALAQPSTAQFIVPLVNIGPPQGTFLNGGYAPGAAPALGDPSRWKSLAKRDPRMKTGIGYVNVRPSWRTNVSSLASPNFPFGPANFVNDPIPSDPGDEQSVLYNSNFPPILSASDGAYALAADLGKVFTGFPWRSLRMQPQPAREVSAGLIPDWVMLDAATFGDGSRALNAANPNSLIVSAGTPVTTRTAAIRSQLDVLTNQTLNVVAHPITIGSSNSAPFSAASARAFQTNAAGIGQIAANAQRPGTAASWSASSGWATRRTTLGFPINALLLPSELAEIRGMADFVATANSNKVNEYRLSALFPGASARGRFYRITAVGEALEGKSANAPTAAKAFLQTLVEVSTNTAPPTIRIINQYPPAE